MLGKEEWRAWQQWRVEVKRFKMMQQPSSALDLPTESEVLAYILAEVKQDVTRHSLIRQLWKGNKRYLSWYRKFQNLRSWRLSICCCNLNKATIRHGRTSNRKSKSRWCSGIYRRKVDMQQHVLSDVTEMPHEIDWAESAVLVSAMTRRFVFFVQKNTWVHERASWRSTGTCFSLAPHFLFWGFWLLVFVLWCCLCSCFWFLPVERWVGAELYRFLAVSIQIDRPRLVLVRFELKKRVEWSGGMPPTPVQWKKGNQSIRNCIIGLSRL